MPAAADDHATSTKVVDAAGDATVTTVASSSQATAAAPPEPKRPRDADVPPEPKQPYDTRETTYWKHRGQYHVQIDRDDPAQVESALQAAARAIDEADAVLILTGAGMGVDMGLADFRSSVRFWDELAHPEIKVYEDSSDSAWFEKDPALMWGLQYTQIEQYRSKDVHDGYRILLRLARAKADYFCFTSNIDGVLQRAGFNRERVMEKHGNIHTLQCTAGPKCPGDAGTWEQRVELAVAPKTFRAEPTSPLPTCPACGALARPNLWFCTDSAYVTDKRRSEVADAYLKWADAHERSGKKLVLIECGGGCVIPGCRLEAEDRGGWCRGTLIRINPCDFAVPEDGEEGAPARSIGIPMGSAEGLRQIAQRSELLRDWKDAGAPRPGWAAAWGPAPGPVQSAAAAPRGFGWGAAGSLLAAAEIGFLLNADGSRTAFPEKLTEEQCKALLGDWSADDAAWFEEIVTGGYITKKQFVEELSKKISNCIKGLEGAPWKDPEYFKTLEAKFVKIAAKHPKMVQPDDWKGSMVREILRILECGPELEKTLADQEMLNEDGDILLGTQDRESLWEIFDSSEDDAPDDVRAFIECHALLARDAKNASADGSPRPSGCK